MKSKSSSWQGDWLVSAVLLGTALIAYTRTLAPTLLEGDPALFQYTPYVLGVTYPTGFPTYILAAKVWLYLFPFGEIAWRMNFFSTFCASITLPILYAVARRVWDNRLAALTTVIIFATLPTYWRWATVAKVYTFNILLLTILLWLALRGETPMAPGEGWGWRVLNKIDHWLVKYRYPLSAFLLGVQIGGHNTSVLLIPGLLLLFWFDFNKFNKRRTGAKAKRLSLRTWLVYGLLFLLPVSSYLYIPLRAEWLIAQYGREIAIAHGLVADFYESSLSGLWRYFTAADFTGGVVTNENWGDIPANFLTVYLPLLRQDFTWLGIILGFVGGLILAWRQPRFFGPLLLIYLAPIPFVLTYGRGEQSAFLLASDLAFACFAGGPVALAGLSSRRPPGSVGAVTRNRYLTPQTFFSYALFIVILVILPYQHWQYNTNWLRRKWDTAMYDYWTDVLSHPLEAEAGLMATWADLTSMWYMQHVENRRPDLLGVYPPTESVAAAWLATGQTLYVAGPIIADWDAGVMERYQVLPWGRLVRLAPRDRNPYTLLPPLSQPQDIIFGQQLHLSGASFDPVADVGETLYASFTWQALTDLPNRTRYSLRLVQGDGIIAQQDSFLRSGWFPLDHIPAGQPLVGAYLLEIPPGTLPGTYHLHLAIYHSRYSTWLLPDGSPVLDLGPVEVRGKPVTTPAGAIRFNGEIALDEFDFSVSRAGQGKGFALQLLWRALKPLPENYTLLVELVDAQKQVWRDWRLTTETAIWQKDQQVRQQIDMIIPAEAPIGEGALAVRLRWLRSDGSYLKSQRWFIPVGQDLVLKAPTILEKSDRVWERPAMQHPLAVNFANKAALIGYDLADTITVAGGAEGILPLTLYWQGMGEMRYVYHTFVHLLDAEGNLVTQKDGIQARGKEATTTWAIGEYITDHVEVPIPADLAPGNYSLVVGLYLPPQGPRLVQLDDQGQPLGDAVQIGTIKLERGK